MDCKNNSFPIANLETLYAWFAGFYLHAPTEDLLQAFSDSKRTHGLSSFFQGKDSQRALKELALYVRKSSLEDLSTEFSSLFVVPNRGSYVPPYESCFIDKNGEAFGNLWGNTTADVKKFYQTTGNDVENPIGVYAPDHIGVELAFVAKLCSTEAEYLGRNDLANADRIESLRKTFLNKHISKWIGDYSEAVKTSASSHFYRNLNTLVIHFIESDLEN